MVFIRKNRTFYNYRDKNIRNSMFFIIFWQSNLFSIIEGLSYCKKYLNFSHSYIYETRSRNLRNSFSVFTHVSMKTIYRIPPLIKFNGPVMTLTHYKINPGKYYSPFISVYVCTLYLSKLHSNQMTKSIFLAKKMYMYGCLCVTAPSSYHTKNIEIVFLFKMFLVKKWKNAIF